MQIPILSRMYRQVVKKTILTSKDEGNVHVKKEMLII